MYMNLEPSKHKIISFNTTTMTSLGFIAPSPPKFNFLLRSPPSPQLFWSEIFRSPLKLERGAAIMVAQNNIGLKHSAVPSLQVSKLNSKNELKKTERYPKI